MDDMREEKIEAETATEAAASTPGQPQPTGVETAPAIQPPKVVRHSWVYHFFNFFLGKETRVGWIMRPVLRWTAAIVGLFGLGLLAGYLLLYQPTQLALDSANLHVSQSQIDLNLAKTQAAGLQNTLTAANQTVKAAQDETKKALARNNLLVVIYDVANARTYLAQKDGARLITALDKARGDLDVVQPYILGVKKDLSDELTSRIETVRSVVVRDSTLAQSDLDNLFTALLTANDLLFGGKP